MEKVRVKVSYSGDNYGAVTEDERLCGFVVVTSSTYEELIKDLRDAICEYVKSLIADGDIVPEWLKEDKYDFDIERG